MSASTARLRALLRFERPRGTWVVAAGTALAVAAYVGSLASQHAALGARNQLTAYVQRSVLLANSAWNARADVTTQSVDVGSPVGSGHLTIRLPPLPGEPPTDLYITGEAPLLHTRGATIDVLVDGRHVGRIAASASSPDGGLTYDADPALGDPIAVPPNPETGYRFNVPTGVCRAGCMVRVETNRAEWQFDRVGLARFGSNAEPPVLLFRVAR